MRKITNEELGRPTAGEFAAMEKMPVTVVLDNVRSLQNVGAFFRTGDAFAVEHIALCGITAVPPNRDIHKTALGAELTVPWSYYETTEACIDRLIDVFPAEQQQQVRVQLSMVLQAVVSQQLLPCVHGGRVPAFEVMRVNRAVRNMIREGKVHQLDNVIFSGASEGMRAMDNDLYRLYKEGMIARDDALLYAIQPETLEKRL